MIILIGAYFLFFNKGGILGENKMTNRVAVFETNLGTFKIELSEDKMPETTKNFIDLTEKGFYDGTRFHRVIANFMIQGGDPLSKDEGKNSMWGTGGPDYEIDDEFSEDLSNLKGTIAMANHGPNTGGSQFFINLADNTYLDFNKPPYTSKHPVFGEVIEGMDVVEKIAKVKTNSRDQPQDEVIVEKISVE